MTTGRVKIQYHRNTSEYEEYEDTNGFRIIPDIIELKETEKWLILKTPRGSTLKEYKPKIRDYELELDEPRGWEFHGDWEIK